MKRLFIAVLMALPPAFGAPGQQMLIATQGTPIVYLLSDNLEYADATAALLAGWTQSGLPTWGDNTSPAPLQGSYSVRCTSGTNQAISPTFSSSTTLSSFCLFNMATLTNNTGIIKGLNGATTVYTITVRSTGAIQINAGGSDSTASASFVSPSQTYWLWWKYIAGSGSDAQLYVWISTNSTRPPTPIRTITTGTSTLGVDTLKFLGGSSTPVIIDMVRASVSDIGSNPI